MPRTHPPYAAEYRRRIVELARGGRSITALAREFDPTVETMRQWVKQAGLDEGPRSDGLTTTEREELNRLRRKNRVLREERDILSNTDIITRSEARAPGVGRSTRSHGGVALRQEPRHRAREYLGGRRHEGRLQTKCSWHK